MAETYSVEAYLKATGADKFANAFRNATKDVEGLDRATGNAGITIGKLAAAVGVTALVAKGFNMVKDSVQRAFGRIDTMEQFERVMTTLTGSTDKANEVLSTVNDTVVGTAYGLDVGAKAVQNFVTSNMDVDKATATFEAWGDAVAFYGDGTNETLGSVTDALAKATAKGKIQMDTMNRLAEAGVPAMQIYADATGQSVEDVADQMQKGELRADKFMDVMNDAMANGTKNFESIKGAAKEAGASWTGSFDNMRAAVARGVIAIIQNIDEMLTSNGLPDMREMVANFGKKFEEVLKTAADAIPVVAAGIKRVYDTLKPWLPLMTAIVAGVLAMVTAFSVFNTVKSIIVSVKAAWVVLNAVMAANPWLWIAGAIVAAAILVYVYWEPISKFFVALWDKIKVAGVAVWDWLKDVWATTVDFFVGLWTGVTEFFTNLWNGIVEFATSVWDTVIERWNAVINFVHTIFGPLIEFYSGLWTTIVDTALEIWDTFTTTLSTVWENIQVIASAAWELIKNVILGPILLLINLVTGDMEEFKSNLSQIWDNIKTAGKTIWEALKTILVTVITSLIKTGLRLWENFKSTVTGLWEAIKTTASNIWSALKTSIVTLTTNLKTAAIDKFTELKEDAINKVKELVKDLLSKWDDLKSDTLDKIKEVKDNVINPLKEIDLLQIGKDVIQGFINGIKSKVEGVANAARDAASAVTGKIKSILRIKSPSRVFMGFGENVSEGLAIGISSMSRVAERASEVLGLGVSDAFTPELSLGGIGSQVNAINGQAHRQMQNHLTSEFNVSRQPVIVNIYDNKEAVRAYVNENNAIDAQIRRF